jgi:hypothetical protein
MRLSIEKRLRAISIYFKNNLHFMKNKYDNLSKLSALEGIFASKLAMRNLISKWGETGSVCLSIRLFIFTN